MPHLLLIAPDSFPPNLISGSIRNVKTVTYLAEHGWRSTVFTADNGIQIVKKSGLTDELPTETEIIVRSVPLFSLKHAINKNIEVSPGETVSKKKQILAPLKRIKHALFGFIRMLLLVPDDFILWMFPVVWYVWRHRSRLQCDIVMSSGPPFSAHITGLLVAKLLRKPFVPDYRDPWMEHEAFAPRNRYRMILETFLERKIIQRAACIPCATQPMIDDFLKRYKKDEGFQLIGNGFDPRDFSGPLTVEKDGPLHFAYIGSFGYVFDPRPFFKQLKIFVQHNMDRQKNIKVTFAGLMTDDLSEYFNDPVLAPIMQSCGKVPHDTAVSLIRKADVLLLFIFAGFTGYTVMTNKLYEYIGARKSILAIVPDGVARHTIEQHNLGVCCYHDDADAVYKEIARVYNEWEHHRLHELPAAPPEFTRIAQVAALHRLLTALLK